MSSLKYYKERRQQRKRDGLCQACGRKVKPGNTSCPVCLEKRKKYREKNKEKIYEKQKQVLAERYSKLSKIKMESGCVDCGYKGHPHALQFDHVSGDKVGHVSYLVTKSWNVALKEIEKCEIVCANCHAIRTFNRKNI